MLGEVGPHLAFHSAWNGWFGAQSNNAVLWWPPRFPTVHVKSVPLRQFTVNCSDFGAEMFTFEPSVLLTRVEWHFLGCS